MKKYLVLTSVLALAACGGGHHGGNGVSPVTTRAAVDSTAIESNKNITSMASEILVANGTAIAPSVNRSASAVYNGQTYESYRLDDVEFKIGGEDSLVKFEVDDTGKIVAMGKHDRSDDFTGNPLYSLSEEGSFVRVGDTSDFAKTLYHYGYDFNPTGISIADEHFRDIEFMDDSGDLTPSQIREKLIAKVTKEMNKVIASQDKTDMESYNEGVASLRNALRLYIEQINSATDFDAPEEMHAKVTIGGVNNENGLRYADLGFAELVATDASGEHELEHTFSPYVGGYNVIEIKPSDLANDTTYSGVAIAGIDYKREGSVEAEKGVLVRDDAAVLTMNRDGSSSLVMNNLRVTKTGDAESELMDKKWYNVTVNRDTEGLPTFIVNGDNAVAGYDLPNGPTPESGVSFTRDEWFAPDQQYVKHYTDDNGTPSDPSDDIGHRYAGNAEATIYGLDAGDTEATSRFGFSDEQHWNNNAEHHEVAIYGAFGGTHE